MPPALVIFDCDGVLVDSERMEVGTLAEALTWVGCDLDAAGLHDRNRGGVLADLFALIEDDLGGPLPDWYEARYRALQIERLHSVDPVPGAPDVVDAVVRAGLPRCVVSGGPMAKMRASLGATGLWEAFDPHLYSCYDIDDHKPSPGIYLHALGVFGAPPTECLAIEDSVNGVRSAAGAGVPVIGHARDTLADDLVAAGAFGTIASMHALTSIIQAGF